VTLIDDLATLRVPVAIGDPVRDWPALVRVVNAVPALLEQLDDLRREAIERPSE